MPKFMTEKDVEIVYREQITATLTHGIAHYSVTQVEITKRYGSGLTYPEFKRAIALLIIMALNQQRERRRLRIQIKKGNADSVED